MKPLPIRMYTFAELMKRLTSPDWSVSALGSQFFFIPTEYMPAIRRRKKS